MVGTEVEPRPQPEMDTEPGPDRRLTLTPEQAEILERIAALYRFGLPDLS